MKKSATQWNKGKGCDTFGPLGPVARHDRRDQGPAEARACGSTSTASAGRRGNTSTMIFGVAKLVADVSRYMTLLPGDVITTGTPPGVGLGMKPPQWLKAGDVITLGIDGLGEQKQKVVAFKGRGAEARRLDSDGRDTPGAGTSTSPIKSSAHGARSTSCSCRAGSRIVESAWEQPALARFLERARVVRTPHPDRPARHRAVRPRRPRPAADARGRAWTTCGR